MKQALRTRAAAAAVILALVLTLAGCAPKVMETFAAWSPGITFRVGSSWAMEIPSDGKDTVYAVTENTVPGLTAQVEGNRLLLSGQEVGEGQLTLSASAKGYEDTIINLPVAVTPHPMDLTWALVPGPNPDQGAGDGPPAPSESWTKGDGLILTAGSSTTLSLTASAGEDTQYALDLPGALGTAELQDGAAVLTAGEGYGEGTLAITASAKNHEEKTLSIPVTVVLGRLSLSLEAGGAPVEAIDLENGAALVLTASAGEGAGLEASLTGSAAKVEREGNRLTVTGLTPGEGTLTVSASKEGWLGDQVTLPLVVTKTKAVVTPAKTSVSVEPGASVEVPYTTKPAGAAVTASVQGEGFTASVAEGKITIAAAEDALGTAQVALSVTAPDYADGKAAITAAARLEPVRLTVSKGNVTLEEGESETLTVTATPEGCAIDVRASGEVTADYSGGDLTITAQGDGSVTVTATKAGREPVSLTVKVKVAEAVELPDVDTSTYASDVAEIIRLTNEYRAENGIGKLSHISAVDIPATIRAGEAADSWSHTRPDGSEFHTVFAQCGLSYSGYGENLFAVNTRYTPAQVVQAWKDSPGHNENLLRPQFTGIGVGVRKVGDEYFYCQLFIQK